MTLSQTLQVSISAVLAIVAATEAVKPSQWPLSSSGCGSAIPKEVTIGGPSYNFTDFASNSSTKHPLRAYSLAVPIDYNINEPAPLILSFHGRGENNQDQEEQSQFSNPYFNTKAISVYPMGIDRQWQSDPAAPPSINDTLFTLELLSHLTTRFCISPTQIYAAGKSNGGGFVSDLACNPTASSQIAAFAAAPLAWYISPPACNPSRSNVPILEIHGGNDKRIVYQGGSDKNRPGLVTEAIPAWLQQWAGRDDCTEGNRTVPLKEVVGGFEVNVTTWRCGPAGEEGLVSHYFSEQMTHVWPTAENAGFNGTAVMMGFFGRWRGGG